MNLLNLMGVDPKEYAKVEAKIGLELAMSSRLEYRVKNLLRERIDGFMVEDLEHGKCWDNYEECEEIRRDDDYYPHTSNVVLYGECEAFFRMVCPALEEGHKHQEVCIDCPLRDKVYQLLAKKELRKGNRDKDQESLSKYLPLSESELDEIQWRIDKAIESMGLLEHRIEKGVQRLLEDCRAQGKGDCEDCPFEDICY